MKNNKNRVFSQTIKDLKNKPSTLLKVFLIDILLIILIVFLARTINKLQYTLPTNQLVLALITYYLILLFAYSIAKLLVWKEIFTRYGKKIRGNIKGFFVLNLISFLIIILASGILGLMVSNIKDSIAPYIALLTISVICLHSLILIKLSQIKYLEGKSISRSIKHSLAHFWRLKKWYGIYLVILISIFLVVAVFSVVGKILEKSLFQDPANLLAYNQTYISFFVFGLGIFFYLSILFNRFYIFKLINK